MNNDIIVWLFCMIAWLTLSAVAYQGFMRLAVNSDVENSDDARYIAVIASVLFMPMMLLLDYFWFMLKVFHYLFFTERKKQ